MLSVLAELAAAVLESTELATTGIASTELSTTGLASIELATAGLVSTGLVSDDADPPLTNATPYSSVSLLTFADEDPQFVITPFEAQSQ
jgi:hypothetical protein